MCVAVIAICILSTPGDTLQTSIPLYILHPTEEPGKKFGLYREILQFYIKMLKATGENVQLVTKYNENSITWEKHNSENQ